MLCTQYVMMLGLWFREIKKYHTQEWWRQNPKFLSWSLTRKQTRGNDSFLGIASLNDQGNAEQEEIKRIESENFLSQNLRRTFQDNNTRCYGRQEIWKIYQWSRLLPCCSVAFAISTPFSGYNGINLFNGHNYLEVNLKKCQ